MVCFAPEVFAFVYFILMFVDLDVCEKCFRNFSVVLYKYFKCVVFRLVHTHVVSVIG